MISELLTVLMLSYSLFRIRKKWCEQGLLLVHPVRLEVHSIVYPPTYASSLVSLLRAHISQQINHSCAPSARPSFENGTSEMHLIAQRAIKAGEEITVSYVDTARHSDEKTALDARKHRRMELALGWGFACDCTRCKEEAVSMKLTTGESSLFSSSAKVKLEPAVERYLNANE